MESIKSSKARARDILHSDINRGFVEAMKSCSTTTLAASDALCAFGKAIATPSLGKSFAKKHLTSFEDVPPMWKIDSFMSEVMLKLEDQPFHIPFDMGTPTVSSSSGEKGRYDAATSTITVSAADKGGAMDTDMLFKIKREIEASASEWAGAGAGAMRSVVKANLDAHQKHSTVQTKQTLTRSISDQPEMAECWGDW